MSKAAELYACLYAKEFSAQTLLRLQPELRTQPCVVMQGSPPLEQVCSLNAQARQMGLAHGMSRGEVEIFPDAAVLTRSLSSESSARAALFECAAAFSPRVEARCEETAFLCGIDIAGTHNLFGPPETLAGMLLDRVKTLGIAACVAVSGNLHAAVCAAKSLRGKSIQVIAPGEEAKVLAPLPLTVLDLTEDQAETFSLWGIRDLGMLAALPEKELIARMGQEGHRLRQLALGELPHIFQPIEQEFLLEEKLELDSAVEQMESLLFVAGVMLDQLIARATARIVALASLTVKLTLESGAVHTRTVRPALPSNDKQLWIKLLHLDLEAHSPQAAILALSLRAEPGSTSKVQMGLFSPQMPESSRLDVTLARIEAIVGEGNVGRAVLEDTHAPDGFRVEPFTVFSRRHASKPPLPQQRISMRQIRPAEITTLTLRNSRPARFIFREKQYRVEQAYGPWLTNGNWWQPSLWSFEQWDLIARGEDGAILCCCVMRDVLQEEWRIAGLYD